LTIFLNLTGSDLQVTDYTLTEPAKCPNCRREIFEKTLVELAQPETPSALEIQ